MNRDQAESSNGIYEPRNFKDGFLTIDMWNDEIGPALAMIDKICGRAKLDGNRFCFGLLDPASNVIVNSIIISVAAVAAPLPTSTPVGKGGGKHDRSQLSLDGLVAFLTTLFPYLPRREATTYLYTPGADSLVAALLIIDRRGLRRFGFCSGTTAAVVETALRYVPATARLPDPQKLMQGWKLLAPHLKKLVSGSGIMSTSSSHTMLSGMLSTTTSPTIPSLLDLQQVWELASSRTNTQVPKALLSPVRRAMKCIVLSLLKNPYAFTTTNPLCSGDTKKHVAVLVIANRS